MNEYEVPDLPPENRELSSMTGWTRAHWEAVADRSLLVPRTYASPQHALIDLPGPTGANGRWSDGLEAFARTFLLAGFRLAGAKGRDPHGFADWYAGGLAAGTDPASGERWPTLAERRQARVEAACIAIALHETRPWIWDRLSERTRQQIVDWLAGIVGTTGYTNNWVWFQNVIEAFLRSVGGPWSSADMDRNLALHERWYAGNGWYSDGLSRTGQMRNFDYYNGWVMQFFSLWFCRMLGDSADVTLLRTYRERLERHLFDAQHLVAADGAPLFQGRSLTYRYAMLAPFWAGSVFDATPLAPGLTRRLSSAVLRYFLGRGALDERSLQPVGWHGSFPRLRQLYSGSGSPYYSALGFTGLLLAPDHPVWTEPERPLPVEQGDFVVTLSEPGWIVSGTASDGIVRLANHGSDHTVGPRVIEDSPFYARYGYATHAAPELSRRAIRDPLDSHIALLDAAGKPSHRSPLRRGVASPGSLVSVSRTHWRATAEADREAGEAETFRTGPWLTTASIVRGAAEVRLARIEPADDAPEIPSVHNDDPDAVWPADRGPWRLRFGGFAIAADDVPTSWADEQRRAVVSTADGLISAVVGLRLAGAAGVAESRGSNPLGIYSGAPWVATSAAAEYDVIYAVAVVLSGNRAALDTVDRIVVDARGDDVTVQWPDGATSELTLARGPLLIRSAW